MTRHLTRHPMWQGRVEAVLRAWQHAGVDPLTRNCALYARELVLAVVCVDPLDALGVSVWDLDSPLAQQRLLVEHGDEIRLATAALGEPVPRLQARAGDLAAIPGVEHGRYSLGVVDGDLVHCLGAGGGIAVRALSDAVCGWRLGNV